MTLQERYAIVSAYINNQTDKGWEQMLKALQPAVQEEPMTNADCHTFCNKDGWLTGVVAVELSDIIENDFEGFLDILGEKIGFPLLSNITYKVVGFQQDDVLLIQVEGDTSESEPDFDEWSIEECMKFIDVQCGLDCNTIEISTDESHRENVEAWQAKAEACWAELVEESEEAAD